LKRAIPQEPKPESCQLPEWDMLVHSDEHQREGSEGSRRVRNSAAMLGLALSVGASSIFFPRHKEAAAAETPSAIRLASRLSLGMPLANLPDSGSAGGSSTYHTVAPGQTLWQIAQVHGVEIDVIKAANGVTPESTLQPGQVLRIPARPAPAVSAPAPVAPAPTASAPATPEPVAEVPAIQAESAPEVSEVNADLPTDLTEKSLLVTEAEDLDEKSLLVQESEDREPKLTAKADVLEPLEASQRPTPIETSEELAEAPRRDRSQVSFSIQPRATTNSANSAADSVEAEATADEPVVEAPTEQIAVETFEVETFEVETFEVETFEVETFELDQPGEAPTVAASGRDRSEVTVAEEEGQLPEALLSETPIEVARLELPDLDGFESAEDSIELESFTQVEQSSQQLAALIDQGERSEQGDLLTEESAAPTAAPSAQPSAVSAYQIQPGDTLETIARAHGVDRNEIAQANNLSNPDRIFAGASLTIPSTPQLASNASQPVAVHPSLDSRFRPAEVAPQEVPDRPAAQIEDSRLRIARLQATTLRSSSSDIVRLRQQLLRSSGLETVENREEAASAELAEPAEMTGQEPESGTAIAAVAPEAAAEAATDLSAEPDTEQLVSQVRDLRQSSGDRTAILARLQQNRQTEAVTLETPVEVETTEAPTEETQVAAAVINPEFRNRNRPQEVAPAEAAPEADGSVTGEHAELMAAAPLGSEAYAPMNNQPVGRQVSPGMPMLPDASEYLPEAPNRFDGFIWPASGVFTSGYGQRWGRMHRGIDIAGPVGTPIVAAAPGVVVTSGWNAGGYGYMVDIRHPDGTVTRYAHNSRNMVRVGQEVRQGEQIAAMGSTGFSTGPHVHFEIHKPGQGTVNPMAHLPSR
jgi:murein DD-endopeptidase MepM/ murein hydrolase activator NlpD